jgi:hypothetical protein
LAAHETKAKEETKEGENMKKTIIQDTMIITGIFLLLVGVWHPILPPVVYTQCQYQSTSKFSLSIFQEVPSEVLLDIPGHYQDAGYLYLSPQGLCRFTSRQIIIDYWHQLGYIPYPTPTQGQLVWEETNASVPKELVWQLPEEDDGLIHNHEWSYQIRGLYVEHALFITPFVEGWTNYWAHWIIFSDPTLFVNVMKYYLSRRVPLDFALYLNSTGLWSATENGEEQWANHAVVFYGYNSTGFIIWNPRTEGKPYAGPNQFISNDILMQGLTHGHCWSYTLAVPTSYALQNICVIVTVKLKYPDGSPVKNYPISTNFNDAVYTDQNGVVSLKVNPFFDQIYIGYLHSQLSSTYESGWNGLGQLDYHLGVVSNGDTIEIKFPRFDSAKAFINSSSYVKPIYTPPPEIPRKTTSEPETSPSKPLVPQVSRPYYKFPSEFIAALVLISVGVVFRKRKAKT